MREDNVYEKEGVVLLVQTDHLSGEVMGTAVSDLYNAGAFNVQVIPSVTKKNRPGHLFVIDCAPDGLRGVENVILDELESTGWHRLTSGHRHVATQIREYLLEFDTPKGPLSCSVRVKTVKSRPGRQRPEHDSCVQLRDLLKRHGMDLSFSEVRQIILERLNHQQDLD